MIDHPGLCQIGSCKTAMHEKNLYKLTRKKHIWIKSAHFWVLILLFSLLVFFSMLASWVGYIAKDS